MPAPAAVVLNALFLAPGESGGPEAYLRGLVPALAREFPKLRITLATTRAGAAALRAESWTEFVAIEAFPCDEGQRVRRQLAEQVLLARLARRGGAADVLHSLASVAPIRAGVPHAITLHDVTFILRQTFGQITTLGMRWVVAAAARRADALITATAAARDEICAVLGLDPSSFVVVAHGVPPIGPAAPLETVSRRYDLEGARVVLCVAAKRPHKNQELLVRAAALLDPDTVIVLAGHPEPYDAQLRVLAAELGTSDRLRFVDYLADAELEALWQLAGCMAMPTLGEGFGIPVIEALARGVPIAASDLSVLHEVGGALPHYFDPHSPAQAAAAIRAALVDADARTSGPAHASRFTWRAAAQGTYEAYERALGHTRR